MTTQRSTISLLAYCLFLFIIHVFADDSFRWAWMGGTSFAFGVYGELHVPSVANRPGARYGALGYYDSTNQELWLFGGYGYGSSELG